MHIVFGDGCFNVFNRRPSVAVALPRPARRCVVLYHVIQLLLRHARWSWWYSDVCVAEDIRLPLVSPVFEDTVVTYQPLARFHLRLQ